MPPIRKELSVVPAERALKIIGGRWKVFILYFLFERTHRLSELKRLIPQASQKVLVQQLREMEEHGVVQREVFAQVPPRVEYSVTKLGLSLQPIVASLCAWGRRHEGELRALVEVRASTEAREREQASGRPSVKRGRSPERVLSR